MTLPCTGRLSFDFWSSNVSISTLMMRYQSAYHEAWRPGHHVGVERRTMSTKLKVKDFSDTNVHNPKEALIASLELALIEDLDGDDGGIFDGSEIGQKLAVSPRWNAVPIVVISTNMSKFSFQYGLRVRLMTLVEWVCSASTVMTANGSGRRNTSRLHRPSAATTGARTKVNTEAPFKTIRGLLTCNTNLP